MSAEKLQKIAQEVEQEQGYGGTASGLYADIWMEAYRRLEANQDKDWKRVGELANEITKIVRNETN